MDATNQENYDASTDGGPGLRLLPSDDARYGRRGTPRSGVYAGAGPKHP